MNLELKQILDLCDKPEKSVVFGFYGVLVDENDLKIIDKYPYILLSMLKHATIYVLTDKETKSVKKMIYAKMRKMIKLVNVLDDIEKVGNISKKRREDVYYIDANFMNLYAIKKRFVKINSIVYERNNQRLLVFEI